MHKGPPGGFRDPHGATFISVSVPKSRDLATLLRNTGRPADLERLLNAMANAADPGSGINGSVELPVQANARGRAGTAAAVTERLAGLLQRARAENHPAAGQLAGVAAQLGITDPGPAPGQAA